MASKTEKKMKEAGFKFGFGMGKPTSNLMEGLRRRLSKTGLSAADKKKLKELQEAQQKRDAAKTAGERSAKSKIGTAEKKAKETSKKSMTDAQKKRIAAGSKSAMSDKQKQAQTKKAKKIKVFPANKSDMSDAQKKRQITSKKSTKTSVTDKQKKTQTKMPTSVGAAQKAGKLYFTGKDGKKKLAITAAQLKKSGMSLRQFANKYKNKGMKAFLADLKKMAMGGTAMKKKGMARGGMKKGMAMGGSMKKKGMARGGMKKKGMAVGGAMKKKGMARGGMKKKGYAMGGLKATNPSQVGLRKLPQKVGDKKQVDHKNMNPNDNRRKNLRVLPAKLNMSRQPARKPRRRK
jgi:hypothetical protein